MKNYGKVPKPHVPKPRVPKVGNAPKLSRGYSMHKKFSY